jgi:hypothetical protein
VVLILIVHAREEQRLSRITGCEFGSFTEKWALTARRDRENVLIRGTPTGENRVGRGG